LESEVLSVDKQFVLSQFISLSLVDVLSKLGLLAKIKWPNDIYVNDKKIAGILIENQLSGMKLRSSIVGVGLNVNQIDFENISATSVQLETDEFSSIHTILLSFLFELNKNWKLVESNKFSEINTSYLNSLYRKDVTAIYSDEKGTFSGVILGVTDYGNLILKSNEREKLYYDLKEVSFI